VAAVAAVAAIAVEAAAAVRVPVSRSVHFLVGDRSHLVDRNRLGRLGRSRHTGDRRTNQGQRTQRGLNTHGNLRLSAEGVSRSNLPSFASRFFLTQGQLAPGWMGIKAGAVPPRRAAADANAASF